MVRKGGRGPSSDEEEELGRCVAVEVRDPMQKERLVKQWG